MNASFKLTQSDLCYIEFLIRSGERNLRKVNRIKILLLLHQGKGYDEIKDFLDINKGTIWRTKKRYLDEGIENALEEKFRSGRPAKYNLNHLEVVAAVACGPCPKGRKRWTLQLLTEELKKRKGFETINAETIRLILKRAGMALG